MLDAPQVRINMLQVFNWNKWLIKSNKNMVC